MSGERTDDADRIRREIAALVDTLAGNWGVPGVTVVVTDADGVIFEHCFGWAEAARREAVTPAHLFEIGSISKVATAAVVLQLAEEGLLRLGDPIASVLPWLTGPLAGAEVTLERLLHHSAGIVSGVDAVPDETAQVAGYLAQADPHLPPSAEADDGDAPFFHYSNLGFILLGLAAAQVSGTPLPELVSTRILKPARMHHSISRVTHESFPRLARGYQPRVDDRPWIPGDPLIEAPWMEVAGADGNIAATGADLAGFARALLRAGAGMGAALGTAVLSPAAFAAMTTDLGPGGEDTLVLDGVPPCESSRYGLGVNVETVGGRTRLSHGGGMVGYASFLLVDPGRRRAVAVLTNANGDSPIAEAIARYVLELAACPAAVPPEQLPDPQLWSRPTESGPSPARRPRELLDSMLGDFVSSADGRTLTLAATRASGPTPVEVGIDGTTAPLTWSWSAGALTPHPSLRRFPLVFDGAGWSAGPDRFRPSARPGIQPPEGHGVPTPATATDDATTTDTDDATTVDPGVRPRRAPAASGLPRSPYSGHFRSFTPWFTNFRVVEREDALILIASPGVEAPGDELELVELTPGVFRMGADPRLPERLVFGPQIEGRAVWVERDGCRYSRAFTE